MSIEVLTQLSEKHHLSKRIKILFAALISTNLLCWTASLVLFYYCSPSSIPLLLVAYTLGLQHAMDADHIAAIDNTTRTFIHLEDGRKPVTLGLYFSLGHSTIVLIATAIVAAIANSITIDASFSIIGTCISSVFLLLIGLVNSLAVWATWKELRAIKDKPVEAEELEPPESITDIPADHNKESSCKGGLFAWGFGSRLFPLVDRPWKMYLVGLLFGLSFDTATEISLLSIVVIENGNSQSSWITLSLAILFTCGMTLVDSIDAVLMLKIYDHDAISNVQRLLFSLFVTCLSIFFAFGVAIINILELIQSSYNLQGSFWEFVANSSNSAQSIGIFMVCCFILAFAVATAATAMMRLKHEKEII